MDVSTILPNEGVDNVSELTNTSQSGPEEGLPLFAQVTVSLMMLSMVAIVTGNILVLAAFLRFRTLQDITGIFVVNLALSDLIIGLALPFQVAFFFAPELEQNKYACLLRYIIILFACNSSIYSLVCTVIDRFIAIAFPLRYPSIMTKKVALVMVVCIWTLDFSVASIPLFAVNNWDTSPFCLYEFVMNKYFRFANHGSGIVLCLFMFLVYVRIYFIVRQHVNRIQDTTVHYPGGPNTRETKQMNTVIAIVVLFFQISWLPFFIVELTMFEIQEVTQEKVLVANFLVFLGVLNSIVNPIVYAWKNKQYRRAFQRLLGLKVVRDDVVTISTVTDSLANR